MRQSDAKKQYFTKSSRYEQRDGQWYFKKREKELLGPYPDILEAQAGVEVYIALANFKSDDVTKRSD
ncbi:MAG: hypothetical protein HWE27_10620 [Gammaproteobacteria bacterium]|nr:hypothetical protein [Gammaproteobacteria bacterium]